MNKKERARTGGDTPTAVPTRVTIQLPFAPASVKLAGLEEQPQPVQHTGPAPVLEAGGKVNVTLPPKKIVSLRMERA